MIKLISKTASKSKTAGFTLIELMVTLTIFAITTGIVMFSQNKFDNSVLLSNLAYDVAITIRQAQTYGINIKEFDAPSGGRSFVGYGVVFDLSENGSLRQFNLFADADAAGNNRFDGNFLCQTDDIECISKYIMKRGNYITSICAGSGPSTCVVGEVLTISFDRPNPDAIILLDDGASLSDRKEYAKIVISSADGSSTRSIVVRSTGQIYVEK